MLKDEFCDWDVLKKCLETMFNRHNLKYSTLHGHFLFREQKCDESFSSFDNELWTLCDGDTIAIFLSLSVSLVSTLCAPTMVFTTPAENFIS